MKFSAMLWFVGLWSILIYAPVAHAVWHPNGFFFGLGAAAIISRDIVARSTLRAEAARHRRHDDAVALVDLAVLIEIVGLAIPILVELRRRSLGRVGLFSGVEFSVAPDQGLNGICDYLISQAPEQLFIRAPVLAIVEALACRSSSCW